MLDLSIVRAHMVVWDAFATVAQAEIPQRHHVLTLIASYPRAPQRHYRAEWALSCRCRTRVVFFSHRCRHSHQEPGSIEHARRPQRVTKWCISSS